MGLTSRSYPRPKIGAVRQPWALFQNAVGVPNCPNPKCPNSSRQEKPRSRGGAAETARKNSVGSQSHPEKVSHPPEASLASSSEMAARSVDSECQSRVIESRKDIYRWSLRRGVDGGNTGAPQRGKAPRSGRDLRAGQRRNGVLWEPGSTVGLLGTTNRSG